MPTFSMGGDTIEGYYTVEEATAQLQQISQLRETSEAAKTLRDVKHLHVFGYQRQCECGMTELEYVATCRDSGEDLCPLAKAKAVQTPAEFAEQLHALWGQGVTRYKWAREVPMHKLAADGSREYLHGDSVRLAAAVGSMLRAYDVEIHF